MKHQLLLPLLLLGTVAALHLGNDVLHLDSQDTEADLSQDLEGSGEQKEELVLTKEVIQSEQEQMNSSSSQNDFEDEEDMESDPSDLDENLQCPRTEDTVEILGSPQCKTCRYLLVRTLKTFRGARRTCSRCYRGCLVSIHNLSFNNRMKCLTNGVNQGQVWIGGRFRVWNRQFRWIDGSRVDYTNWAAGQPWNGRGRCVTLCTAGGQWRRSGCRKRRPFICSY
ncbi:proteoglycan 3-like [Molossus molossus]|uniref:Proteoglycan 3, pro eosinophil major basic protein 2 n=1 Tax=Molossus molossus TaxID=27622 RepID=A0A7J8ET72_MOLMO|nr:proteoglycan 3-like [Molossus molossus]KAF6438748.1 proteoglycan 3, pro eosinophil major basic protein 2 [Molossus molossus]